MCTLASTLLADPAGIARAAQILRDGGLVAFPTDTVYGVGCRAEDAKALERVFELKRRPPEKRVALLISDPGQATGLGYRFGERATKLAAAFWPGALTLVLPGTHETQGFRMPDHPVALALLRAAGPLATSSANRSGEPETYDAADVLIAFAGDDLLDAVVDGGRVPGGVASSVLDLSVDPPRLLREGPIVRAQLESAIGPVD